MTQSNDRHPARILLGTSKLAERNGNKHGVRVFGEAAIASLPTYQRGKLMGLPKGYLFFHYVSEGGWCARTGRVVVDGALVDAWIGATFLTQYCDAMSGDWLGSHQPLRSEGAYLGEEGRAQWQAEQAARLAGATRQAA